MPDQVPNSMTNTAPRGSIEKTMTLTEQEFVTGCQRLAVKGDDVGRREAKIAVGDGGVVIRFDPRASVRLGGVLELPRALVSLVFNHVTEAEEAAFMRQFDIKFQRGGG